MTALLRHLLAAALVVALVSCDGGSRVDPTSTPPQPDPAGAAALSPADRQAVRQVVAQELQVPAARLDDEKPLIAQAVQLDDLALVEIVLKLEERFGVTIDDADLVRHIGANSEGEIYQRVTVAKLADVIAEKKRR